MDENKRLGIMRFVLKQTRTQRYWALVLSALMLALVYLLVYATGGTHQAYLHAMYIPVVLIAVIFGLPGGVLVGVVAGVVLGPFMPLNVAEGVPQETVNWLFRSVYFIGVGALVGSIMDQARRQYRRIDELHTTNSETGLPNYQKYLTRFNENEIDEADVSISIIVNNYEDIVVLVGRAMYATLMQDIHRRVNNVIENYDVYQVDARKLWLETDNDTFKNRFNTLIELFAQAVFTINSVPMYVDISFGVYLKDDNDFTRLDAFRASEMAALHAKKNQLKYAIYQSDFAYPQHNLEQLGSLPLAIENGELFLEYQPIINLKNNDVVGLEALVRWNKDGEIIAPLDFIPLAEETKIIDSITDWIVTQVIEDYPNVTQGRDLIIHLNVSQRNLHNPVLIESMLDKIKKANYHRKAIGIEMTESTIMLNLNLSRALLETLRKEGIPMSIDDFGVGYSTFSCLYELPVERLKIDRQFVMDMFDNQGAKHLITVIIDFAHKLGIQVIAEGIETEKQERALKARGCDFGQGFYYAKPMSAKRFTAWLVARETA